MHDETLIDLEDEPPLSAGIAGEVLGMPLWDDEPDQVEAPVVRAPERRAPAAAPELGRDATPAFGMIPTGLPTARVRDVDDDEDAGVDLAGLVASVDDDEQHQRGER
jgi:hypothetical protein